MRNKRRKEVESKKKRMRTIYFTLGILVLIYFIVTLIFSENGLLKYLQLRSVKVDIDTEISGIKRRNEEMKRQIDAAKNDPHVIEEIAREHGLMKPGEHVYKFNDEE
jgi:cell division protein FtsB